MLIIALIIFQLIIFSFLIFILRKVMIRNVASATQHLEDLNKDYQRKQQQIDEKMKEAQQQADLIVNQAKEEADKLKIQIIQEAEKHKEELINDARQKSKELIEQAEKSRYALISEIEERIEKEAINKASDLIKDTLPVEFKETVHNYWVDELIKKGFEEISHLNIIEETKEVEVVSALPLSDKQREHIEKRLKEILGKEIQLQEKVEPEIIVGLIVKIGSLVLDGSLKFKIKQNIHRQKK